LQPRSCMTLGWGRSPQARPDSRSKERIWQLRCCKSTGFRQPTDRVWEAIALHSSLGLAHRMGLLTYLTHQGVFTDGGRFADLPPEVVEPIRVAYPRPEGDRSISDAIIKHARRSPAAAPPFSIAAELLRRSRQV
jgi:hypothetical protein